MTNLVHKLHKLCSISLIFFCFISFNSFADIDIRTGAYSISVQDIEGIDRKYSVTEIHKGIFGQKWMAVYDNRVEYSKENGVLFVFDAIENLYYKFKIDSDKLWYGTAGDITEVQNQFIWDYKERKYTFNEQGRLVEYAIDEYRNYTIEYDERSHINRFSNYAGANYEVNTLDDGTVVSFINVESLEPNVTEYAYQDGLLISVNKNMDTDKSLTSEYSYNDNHFLTSVISSHGDNATINYQGYGNQFRVSELIEGNYISTYRYELLNNSDNEKHFSITVNKKIHDEKYSNRYEYVDVYNEGSFVYTKQFKEYENNILISDTKYKNKCSPYSIIRNGKKTLITYNTDGRVSIRETDIGILSYTYNKNGKITYVNRALKDDPGNIKWTKYGYNNNNLLISSENSDGVTLALEYDNNKNITVMHSKDKTLYVSYNDYNKPSKITVAGIGSVEVIYDMHGEIETFKSDTAGHKLAVDITKSFQDMLILIKAATNNTI